MKNVCTIDSDAKEIRQRAGNGKRIGFVSGNFNVLHPGHLRLLNFAADNCDFLVVGVSPDNTPGVTVPAGLRIEGVRAVSMVDYATVLTGPPERFIGDVKPDIVVKGKEFETQVNPELPIIQSYGGKLIFTSGEVRFASIDLLYHGYSEASFSTVRKPRDYPTRHGFDFSDIRTSLAKISGLRVLVIGDLIVDRYIECDALGMSQEDPTIVVTPIDSKTFVGGAGVVAANAYGLGAEVRLLTVGGRDAEAEFARESLHSLGVQLEMLEDDTRPTTLKQRYRALQKTLLRVNHLRHHPIAHELVATMVKRVESLLPVTDVVLFSDFNYGCVPQSLVDAISELARARGTMMAADSQASSQSADISRFKDMRLITPTEREARMAIGDFESGLGVLIERLRSVSRAENIILTLGAEGLLVHALTPDGYVPDRLPAFNVAPRDVAGAGDGLFACSSLALCSGVDIWQSAYLGALAAACQVARIGNTPLKLQDILTEINGPSY